MVEQMRACARSCSHTTRASLTCTQGTRKPEIASESTDACVREVVLSQIIGERNSLAWNNASGSEQSARSGEISVNPERVNTCRRIDGREGAWLRAMLLVSGSWYSATSRSVLRSLWVRSETRQSVKKHVKSLERKQQTSSVRALCRQSRGGQVTRMYSRLLVYLHGVNLIGR